MKVFLITWGLFCVLVIVGLLRMQQTTFSVSPLPKQNTLRVRA